METLRAPGEIRMITTDQGEPLQVSLDVRILSIAARKALVLAQIRRADPVEVRLKHPGDNQLTILPSGLLQAAKLDPEARKRVDAVLAASLGDTLEVVMTTISGTYIASEQHRQRELPI